MSIRTEKVASLLKTELSEIILREITLDKPGFLTVTEVKVTADLKIARVFLSVYAEPEKQDLIMKELNRRKGEIRHLLGGRIRLRFTPDLQFLLDTTLERVETLEKIFKKIRENDT